MNEPAPETSIGELFARDPLSLTRADRDQMVAAFRKNRKKFILGDTQAGSTKKKPVSEKAKALAEAKEKTGPLDISSLL